MSDILAIVIQQALAHGAASLTQQVLTEDRLLTSEGNIRESFFHQVSKCFLVAIGKVSVAMTQAAYQVLGNRIQAAMVIYPEGYLAESSKSPFETMASNLGWAPKSCQILASSHPFPTQKSVDAANQLVEFIRRYPSDHFLFLISGGTSALVEMPKAPFTLDELQRLTKRLLSHSIPIEQINGVRARLSQIKGGGLRRWLPKHIPHLQLSLSDVSADDPSVIGSGLLFPTVHSVDPHLLEPLSLSINDTASPDQSLQWNIQHKVVGNSRALANAILNALSTQLRLNGREEEINTTLEQALKRVELWFLNTDEEILLLHGEVTIKLPSNAGAGGRCSHFALSMARFLAKQRQKSVFVALATDGADGNSEAAGAWVDNSTWKHLETKGLKPQLHLDSYNSYTALNAIGQQILFPRGHSNVRDIYLLVKYVG